MIIIITALLSNLCIFVRFFLVMKIVHSINDLKASINDVRKSGTIGFVPTMGALHKGHISLVNQSVEENPFTVVSVFVNPTQFNDKKDLDKYPRNLLKDAQLLETCNCDMIFAPKVEEMYPEPDNRQFDFGELGMVMEGKHRPGHFIGVGQIVSKLFDIVEPDRSYFGLKDFQQLAIIKKLVKDYKYNIEIISCPIIRESDGLAMSSRNVLLKPDMRSEAPEIFRILKQVKSRYNISNLEEVYSFVFNEFEKLKQLKLEYFEIIDDETLMQVPELPYNKPCSACVAVFAGKVRLIDNIQFNS